jgi:hypothetical protein
LPANPQVHPRPAVALSRKDWAESTELSSEQRCCLGPAWATVLPVSTLQPGQSPPAMHAPTQGSLALQEVRFLYSERLGWTRHPVAYSAPICYVDISLLSNSHPSYCCPPLWGAQRLSSLAKCHVTEGSLMAGEQYKHGSCLF